MKCKKQIVIGITFILISILWTSVCMAKTAIVDTDTLKLRKEPSTESIVLELLNQGEKLEVLEESGDWVKVKVRGMTGYVHNDYIEMQEEEEEENILQQENTITENITSENTTNENGENVVVENNEIVQEENNTITEENNIVREEIVQKDIDTYILPLINSSRIGNLKKDTKVIVIDEVKGWAYIQTEEINGWIRKDALEKVLDTTPVDSNTDDNAQENTDTTNTTPVETPIEEKIMYVNYSSIYVRKGPSTDNEVLDTLILNSQVTVIGEVEDWYKVKLNGETGYIAKRLLSSKAQDTTSRGAEERDIENVEEVQDAEQTNTLSATSTTSKGQEIVNYAKQYLGCKYVYGGSGPSTFDCSGFTMYVYKHFGINLSHSARAQSKNGTYVAKEDLQPGDLVFFKDYETMDGIGHCGIYVGEGNFIHASSGTGYCVKISTLLSGSYNTRYETARRLI